MEPSLVVFSLVALPFLLCTAGQSPAPASAPISVADFARPPSSIEALNATAGAVKDPACNPKLFKMLGCINTPPDPSCCPSLKDATASFCMCDAFVLSSAALVGFDAADIQQYWAGVCKFPPTLLVLAGSPYCPALYQPAAAPSPQNASAVAGAGQFGAAATADGGNSEGGLSAGGIAGVVVGSIGGLALVALLGGAFLILIRRKQRKLSEQEPWASKEVGSLKDPEAGSAGKGLQGSGGYSVTSAGTPKVKGPAGFSVGQRSFVEYSIQDLAEATDNFSADMLLGHGTFGHVYKATLKDGTQVAVKRLKLDRMDSDNGTFGSLYDEEFRCEAEVITRVHHRHLLRLIGYCCEADERVLVLDYMPNNSLAQNLHSQSGPPLKWGTRLQIAIGAAKGLAYLHEDCVPKIIHRDIKPSNILLDAKFEAKVGDFGFAKERPDEAGSTLTSLVVGTKGYVPLECLVYGQRNNEASDVYAFGVVLLNIMTGKTAIFGPQDDRRTLVEWAESHRSAEISTLLDPKLEGQFNKEEAERMFAVAIACVQKEHNQRPSMGLVTRLLQGDVKLPAPVLMSRLTTLHGHEELFSSSLKENLSNVASSATSQYVDSSLGSLHESVSQTQPSDPESSRQWG